MTVPLRDNNQRQRLALARTWVAQLLLIGLLLPTAITLVYFMGQAGKPAAWQQVVFVACKVVQFGLPLAMWYFVLRKIQTLPLYQEEQAKLGNVPRPPQYLPSVALGVASGLIVFVLMGATYFLWLKPSGFFAASLPAMQDKVGGLGVATPAAFFALAVFYSLVHSLLEEYYWRWFVFRTARSVLTFTPALIVASVGFMLHHILVLAVYFGADSPATWLFSAAVAIGGGMWAWLYERYGTLLGPWLSHLLVDAAIFAIGYDLLFN